MSFTDLTETNLLNFLFRNNPDTYASPSAVYVGLLTAEPDESTSVSEISGTGYVRKAVTFNAPATQGATKQIVSSADVLFDEAGSNWGTVTYIGIFDASSAGNFLAYVQLTDSGGSAPSKIISQGDVFTIASGNLKGSLS